MIYLDILSLNLYIIYKFIIKYILTIIDYNTTPYIRLIIIYGES